MTPWSLAEWGYIWNKLRDTREVGVEHGRRRRDTKKEKHRNKRVRSVSGRRVVHLQGRNRHTINMNTTVVVIELSSVFAVLQGIVAARQQAARDRINQ